MISRSVKVTAPEATLASASSSVTEPVWVALVMTTSALVPVMVTLATAAVGVEEKVDVPPEESVEVALRRRNLPTRD